MIETSYLYALRETNYTSTNSFVDQDMTPQEFTDALAVLGWKQSDFCRKTGVSKDTPSRWASGKTPIPAWAPAYLGAMLDLAALHAKYIAPNSSRSDDGN